MDTINSLLKIMTIISYSTKYRIEGNRNEKIISICKQAGADVYVSGPAARTYIDEELFKRESIDLFWIDYSGYPEYNQRYQNFEEKVSVIDLIFNTGEMAPLLMKSF